MIPAQWGRSNLAWEVKPPSSPAFPIYIVAVIYYRRQGKIPILTAFYKLFLSDIKVNILINFWHFYMFFWMYPLLPLVWLTCSVFSEWKVLRWYTYWASFTDMESADLQFKFSNVFVLGPTVFLRCFWVGFGQNSAYIFYQLWQARWCIRYATVFWSIK